MNAKTESIIFKKIEYIERTWNSLGYPKLTHNNGWNQVEQLELKGSNARQKAIQAGVLYGQWRALHDLLGSPYGPDSKER